MFQVNKKDTRMTSVMWFWFFIVNFKHFTPFSNISIVYFEQVNVSWVLNFMD